MDQINNGYEMTKKAALLLLPNLLGEHQHHELFLPPSVDRAVESIDGLIAESEQGGRRYLKRFKTKKPAHDIPLALLNEHTPLDQMDFLLEPMMKGECWGLIADAGVPCVADPGALLVKRAREVGVVIKAFSGPSSILLSLMLSGMNGQNFSFRGYLDRDAAKKQNQLKGWEKLSGKEKATQIFIETPYRNQQTLELLLQTLNEDTRLCVAWDLTLPTQGILSQPVHLWKKSPLPNVNKKPAIFLFLG